MTSLWQGAGVRSQTDRYACMEDYDMMILVPERWGNGVPWSSASEAGLVAVALERAVALGAADLREKNKCSTRVLTAESLEI